MPRFFIDRPIFAWVIAIVIMLSGILSIQGLPVAQYPQIALPAITIMTTYPGASAKTLEDSVTQIIEQQMNGIDNLLYITSSSDSTGTSTITLTFDASTNPDIAQVQVQNKLQLATPLLPQEVQRQGIRVIKYTASFLMVIGFYSANGDMSRYDISDYIATNIQEPLSRVPGVGEVMLFGSPYAMRIWLDADKLNNYKLTAVDVKNAIQAQNVQVSAGQFGAAPAVPGQQLNATVTVKNRLQTPEQFGNIVLRANNDGSVLHLRNVAHIELGSESYEIVSRYNGKPAAGLAIRLASGANAVKTADAVKARLVQLGEYFPQGLTTVYPYDTTPFVKISIDAVKMTLVEAIILVFLVMYLFLQNLRATLIPTITVPVVLLGTLAILFAFGYSINTLTMFAMALAIGLLVDDAIIVVENVERIMAEEGLSPVEATRKSMDQITGALIGVGLVLSSVFVPMAFYGGSTGIIYRQFSLTIVSAMLLSVFVALSLTPALCATLLKPVAKGTHHRLNKRGFFGWFNRGFDAGSKKYRGIVGFMIQRGWRFMLLYVLIAATMTGMFMIAPTGFLPNEDQGLAYTMVQLPPGATQERTLKVITQVENYLLNEEKETVESTMAIAGFGFSGRGQSTGLVFVKLKDWKQRKRIEQKVQNLVVRASRNFAQIRDAMVFAAAPPAVVELGNITGFDLQLQDRGGLGHDRLIEARNQLLGMAFTDQSLIGVRPNGQEDTPQYQLDIDTARASVLGLNPMLINDAIASGWGSSYVNDFIDKGRVKRVYIQSASDFRMVPEDLNKWYIPNNNGEMVPFSSFADAHWTYGAQRLERFNGVPSVEVVGGSVPGISSGDVMKKIEAMVAKLPPGIGSEWTGLSYQEKVAGSKKLELLLLSALVVFLCLAALYESWVLPASVMMVVPLGAFGAIIAIFLAGFPNDVYFMVALLTTMGLASKNAILIVEFAHTMHGKGMSLFEATKEAVRLRLRPILMTSMAFGLGVLPLAVSSGAGAAARNEVGIGVIGGMLGSTFLGIFFVPVFFVTIRRLFKDKRPGALQAAQLSAVETGPQDEGRDG